MALHSGSTTLNVIDDKRTDRWFVRPDIAQVGPTSRKPPFKLALMTGILLSMASPSCTSLPAPWSLGRLRDSSSIYGLYPARRYRRISLSEARRLAFHALFQAEAERIELADLEARTAPDWSEVG